ncbi:hypothetical protein EYC80_000590 [Monilinia laxa]|uniref:thioredoxin-dependent peroxiredoxin n=1 Tax=Monilinia laxa TaxID=61186 RepID=A0A5N6KB60_MONLA|nr:hypothetical protein EYC80_000590 [Monilinia laxa]
MILTTQSSIRISKSYIQIIINHKSPFPSNLFHLKPSSSSSSSSSSPSSSLPSSFSSYNHNVVASSRRSFTSLNNNSYSFPVVKIWRSRKTDLTVRQHSQTYVQQHIKNITMSSAASIYEFEPLNKKGEPTPLSDYKGKVLLIVNTASKCGFTPQFEGLEKLYKDVKEKHGDDFVILGFPCNQFGSQDPGSDEEIQSFCQINYGVSFPILLSSNGSRKKNQASSVFNA